LDRATLIERRRKKGKKGVKEEEPTKTGGTSRDEKFSGALMGLKMVKKKQPLLNKGGGKYGGNRKKWPEPVPQEQVWAPVAGRKTLTLTGGSKGENGSAITGFSKSEKRAVRTFDLGQERKTGRQGLNGT